MFSPAGSVQPLKAPMRYCYLPPRSFPFPVGELGTYHAAQSERWRESRLVGDLQGSVRLGCQRTGNQSQSKGWASLVSRGAIRRETLPRQSYSRYKVGFYPRREKAKGGSIQGRYQITVDSLTGQPCPLQEFTIKDVLLFKNRVTGKGWLDLP